MIHYIQRGRSIQVLWTLTSQEGKAISLDGLTFRLFYITGRGMSSARIVSHAGNVIAWFFIPDFQWATGSYSLLLDIYKEGKKVESLRYQDVFYLCDHIPAGEIESESVQIDETQTVSTINISSVLAWPIPYYPWPIPPIPCPCPYIVDAKPHLELDTNGDYFLGFGETITVTCRVIKAFVDITDKVVRWKVTRDSGDAAEDAAWALREKVVNFNGSLAISYTADASTTDLLTTKNTTRFTFTAYVQESSGEEEASKGFVMIPTEVNYSIEI